MIRASETEFSSASQEAPRPVNVAFIGAGYMASEHLRAFTATESKAVGIYSRSKERAAHLSECYPGLKVCNSIAELYTKTDANLVVISVSELSCKDVCIEAFKYSWTVLIEKPAGHTYKEAKLLESIADSLNANAYVALNRRFYSSTLQLNQEIKCIDGARIVTVLDQEDPSIALKSGTPLDVVNNWMYANSIHLIDFFSQLCRGNHCSTKTLKPWNPETAGPVIAYLEFDSGDVGLYQGMWNAPGPWSVAVSTASLRAELRPIEQLSLQIAGSRQAELQSPDPLDQQFKPGLLRQAQAAIQAAKGQATTLPNLKEANRSMSLVASIYGME